MILSFLRRKRINDTPSRVLHDALQDMYKSLSAAEPRDMWLAEVLSHYNLAAQLIALPHTPVQWNTLAKNVQAMYGAMGSFNDNMYSDGLKKKQETLYSAAENVIRLTRKELGGTWIEVKDTEIFQPGAFVELIKGEVISLNRDESPLFAPSSRLKYRVVSRVSNDIDNMPRYHIKADSHVRWVRHNAIRRVSAS
jgi:hypothetical protein